MTPYYWRTWLRERLPWCLQWMAPRRRRCPDGDHQWFSYTFNYDKAYSRRRTWWACYHCREHRVGWKVPTT